MAAESYPDNLLYTKDHEWCRVEGDVATVGITWHAQNALGDIVFCDLPPAGTDLKQGTPFGVVESVKAVSDLFAPLSGKVTERNESVIQSPDVLNKESYVGGWMLKVKIGKESEVKSLLSPQDYKKFRQESGE